MKSLMLIAGVVLMTGVANAQNTQGSEPVAPVPAASAPVAPAPGLKQDVKELQADRKVRDEAKTKVQADKKTLVEDIKSGAPADKIQADKKVLRKDRQAKKADQEVVNKKREEVKKERRELKSQKR
jgi:hypothetical protein